MERDEDGEPDVFEGDERDAFEGDERDAFEGDERDLFEDDERDLSEERCAFHSSEPAAVECDNCRRAICDRCVRFIAHRRLCRECARSRGKSRTAKRVLTAIVCVGVVGAAVVYFSRSLKPFRSLAGDDTFDYGAYKPVVDKQREYLAKQPCDRDVIVKHAQTLLDAGNYLGLLERADRFFAECGPHAPLRRQIYLAHKRLGEWDRAIQDATTLVEAAPDVSDHWRWRGEAYEKVGRLEEAAADLRQAVKLDPGHKSSPLTLASVLERLEKPCEAAGVLGQYLEQHPEVSDGPAVESRIGQLREAGHCDAKPDKKPTEKPAEKPTKKPTRKRKSR